MHDKSLILNENYQIELFLDSSFQGYCIHGGEKVSSNIWPAMCVTYISNIFKYVLLYSL